MGPTVTTKDVIEDVDIAEKRGRGTDSLRLFTQIKKKKKETSVFKRKKEVTTGKKSKRRVNDSKLESRNKGTHRTTTPDVRWEVADKNFDFSDRDVYVYFWCNRKFF